MKELKLPKGIVTFIDDEDFEKVSQYKWHAIKDHNTYAVQSHVGSNTMYLHRFVTEAPKGVLIDHRDGNGLNNQKWNLRHATHKQNMRNRKIPKGKFKGVSGLKGSKKFRARITVDNKGRHLGLYETEQEAAFAYDRAAKEHFGEFACLNFHPDYEGAVRDFMLDTL